MDGMTDRTPSPASSPVPGALVDRLHGVNERLHDIRRRLDDAIAAPTDSHQAHVDAAAEELRRGQREWEQVDGEIRDALHRQSPPR